MLQLNATCPIKRVHNQEVVRCIQMAFFVVRSKNVQSLIPAMSSLFKVTTVKHRYISLSVSKPYVNVIYSSQSFIRRQIEVKNIAVRGWALKCGISFSLLYEQLAKDVYAALYKQFVKHPNTSIWAISVSGLIELIDRYGFDFFQEEVSSENGETCDKRGAANTLKKSRQLYSADGQDTDDDEMLRRPGNTTLNIHFNLYLSIFFYFYFQLTLCICLIHLTTALNSVFSTQCLTVTAGSSCTITLMIPLTCPN